MEYVLWNSDVVIISYVSVYLPCQSMCLKKEVVNVYFMFLQPYVVADTQKRWYCIHILGEI